MAESPSRSRLKVGERMPIKQFLTDHAFGPDEIQAMSSALEDVCNALNVNGDARARKVIAVRIIELAARGDWSRRALRDHVLSEAQGHPDA